MFITCYASGSAGNLYKIDDGKAAILIECGLKFPDIQKCLGYQISKIQGVLLSHEHKDHSRSVHELLRRGIDVYTSKGTAEALGIEKDFNCVKIKARTPFQIGSMYVLPFETQHDSAEPLGFYICGKDNNILFATDTYNLKYKFKNITKIMIECNHSYEILDKKVAKGEINRKLAERLIKSHFSLENVLKYLSSIELDKVKEIYLLHLSNANSDADKFKNKVEEATGIPTYVADENVLKHGKYAISSNFFGIEPLTSDRGRMLKNFIDKAFKEE